MAWAPLSTYLYGMHQVVSALGLHLLGQIPSQQDIFSKRSLGRNHKIDPFFPTPKPHPLSPLTEGPPLLYWLGTSGCALALMYEFHYPLHLSSFTPVSFLALLPCLILLCISSVHAYPSRHGGYRLLGWYYFLLIPYGLGHWLAQVPIQPIYWAFALVTSLPAMPMDLLAVIPAMLAHWVFYHFPWASMAHLL